MKTYVATENQGKLAEMRAMFANSELELATFADYRAAEEDAESYAGNAMLKARSLEAQLAAAGVDGWVLADDSGLEVDALDGRPGVRSARYAGVHATWAERRGELLRELQGVSADRRGARFVSSLVLLRARQAPIEVVGFVAGRIAGSESGASGFGYDPVFYYEPTACTFAELGDARKNSLSHRFHAVRKLLEALRADA